MISDSSSSAITPKAEPPARDAALDLLRGGAVLYIVGYYHIQEIWVWRMPGSLAGWLARVALALFCFLSGYLLGGKTRITDWKSVGNFYWRRLAKIYPLYLAALYAFVQLGLAPRNLFLPSALLVNTLLNWNLLTLWFVSMIFLFYAVTPFYLWRPRPWKIGLITAALIGVMLVFRFESQWIDPRLFPNLVAFAFGILLNFAPRLDKAFLQPRRRNLVIASVALLVLVFLIGGKGPRDNDETHMIFVVYLFLAALPWLIFFSRTACRGLSSGLIEFLATASFVLYLSHRIIYHFGEIFYHPASPWLRQSWYLLVLLPVALVFSYGLQKLWQRVIP